MGCEMICDQLNLDKNNQMTLGVTGKSNKRMKTIEGLKNGKNNFRKNIFTINIIIIFNI